jgi:hypothetical protein
MEELRVLLSAFDELSDALLLSSSLVSTNGLQSRGVF